MKIEKIYFKAVTSKNDDGWMMCDCGNSGIDNNDHYVITTHHLHADEVPDLCTDSKTFAELVAKLLNEHYNKTGIINILSEACSFIQGYKGTCKDGEWSEYDEGLLKKLIDILKNDNKQ